MLHLTKYPARTFLVSAIFSSFLLLGCQPANDDSAHPSTNEETQIEDGHIEDNHNHQGNNHDLDEHEAHAEHDMHEHDVHTDDHADEHSDKHGHDIDTHHDEHAAHDHSNHDHSHHGHNHDAHRIQYNCEPKQSIGVAYHDDDTPATAHLLIEGIEYDLSLSDKNTYRSDYGFNENHGLIWQVDETQNSATLFETKIDSPEEPSALYRCQKAV